MKLLVVGHGLLGKGVVRCSTHDELHRAGIIDWNDPPHARRQLAELGESFGRSIEDSWRLAWCAGAGVVGTSDTQFADEQSYLQTFLDALGGTAALATADGGVFFASSAGGLFGKGSSGLITEDSLESPVSAYGVSKMVQEEMVAQWSTDMSVPLLIGRLSNLYGPGQNLSKPQGFISQLLRSMLVRQPFQLRASGDTERDFIHVDDAAARIHAWLVEPAAQGITRKLIVAGRSHTLPRVANVARSVTRIQPKIMYAATIGSPLQPHHLRLASRLRLDLDAVAPSRPLEVGIAQTWHAMLRGFAGGSFI